MVLMKYIATISLLVMSTAVVAKETKYQRDFDHQVQFAQEKTGEGIWRLEVSRQNDAKFATMVTFAARQGMKLCHRHGYDMKFVSGVEGFDDRRGMPNKIFPPLVVQITCPKTT
ncbi:hypothetical protein ACFSJY_01630 [Thalassotalea euphylliae]|uniref:hypothetical protein n=1 Tax=Thalassotalea euphylliae TaxID=1655234 RepID=UPI00362C3BB1